MNERAGQELSAEARQLIANARGADDPTAEDEARVKARWLAGIAAGAGVSSLSEAVRAAASTGWSWGLKAAVLAGAGAVAAIGVYLGWPDAETPPEAPAQAESRTGGPVAREAIVDGAPQRAPAEAVTQSDERASAPLPPAAKPAAPEAPAPSPVAGQAPPEPPVDGTPPVQGGDVQGGEQNGPAESAAQAPVPAVQAPAATAEPAAKRPRQARNPSARTRTGTKSSARKRPPAEPAAQEATEAPAAAAAGQLGEEIARLSEIRGQLQAGSPARALELLSDYRSRFVEPNLAMEADALQVDALCKAGKRDAARQAAAAFTSRWPGSPLAQRVTSACQ